MSRKIILFLAGLVLFSSYNFAYAGLVINEIMYDLDGTDTGREWIEVYNDSDTAVDLSTFKFFESNTNHGLTLSEGDVNIGAHGYAVIVSDSVKFKIDWPSFSGTIFDSSFSLSNDGEALAIKDESLNVVNEYTYTSTTGAAGDGNSLQKISGFWIGATPTPGKANETISPSPAQSDSGGNNNASGVSSGSSSTSTSTSQTKTEIKKIKTQILTKVIAFAGIPVPFEALAFGLNGEQLSYGKYFWNFGDGDSLEVKANDINNQKFTHTYFYPGEYSVNLGYYANYYGDVPDASDKITIKVVAADILISKVGDEKDFFIELSNNTSYDADISRWVLSSDKKSFVMPKNTIIGSKKKITISPKITNFSISDKDTLKLMNSQGEVVFDYPLSVLTLVATPTAKARVQTEKNSTALKLPENDLKNENLEIPILGNQILVENLPASAIQSDIIKSDWDVKTIIPYLVSVIFIGAGASGVYFLRRKKVVTNAGDDFNILEE